MKRIKLLFKSAVAAVVKTLKQEIATRSLRYLEWGGLLLYGAPHAGAESLTGTTYAISAQLPATYDAAGYGATTMIYTTIGEVETAFVYGAVSAVQKFTPINGPIEKLKGTPDYGDGDLIMADVPADAGQVILKSASLLPAHYSVKITFPDNEIHYLDVIVASYKYSGGKEGTPKTVTCTIGVCKAPVIIVAS